MKRFYEYLMEQAMNLTDAESRITSMSYEIEVHLLKLLLCGKSHRSYNHWLSEIDAWLKTYNKVILKSTNKRPTKEQVNKWARTEWLNENTYKNDVISIKDQYKVNNDLSYSDFNKIYKNILDLSVSNDYSKEKLQQILERV